MNIELEEVLEGEAVVLEEIAANATYEEKLKQYDSAHSHYTSQIKHIDKQFKAYCKDVKKAHKYATKQTKKEKKRLQKLVSKFNARGLTEDSQKVQEDLTSLIRKQGKHAAEYLSKKHPQAAEKIEEAYKKHIFAQQPTYTWAATLFSEEVLSSVQMQDDKEKNVYHTHITSRAQLQDKIEQHTNWKWLHPFGSEDSSFVTYMTGGSTGVVGFLIGPPLLHDLGILASKSMGVWAGVGLGIAATSFVGVGLGLSSAIRYFVDPDVKKKRSYKKQLKKLPKETVSQLTQRYLKQ